MGSRDLTGHKAGWTETANGSGSSTITATHALEAGKRHYVLGIACSMNTTVNDHETMGVSIKDDSTTILLLDGASGGTTANQDSPGDGPRAYASQPLIINFDDPIEIGSGNPVSIEVDPSGSYSTRTCANIWGFTLDG